MADQHILRMTEQIGQLNGTVESLKKTIENHIEQNAILHRDHYKNAGENKVAIEKINTRHSTYWKIIGSCGGLGAFLAGLLKIGGGGH